MDACVDQAGGYRFLYVLPFDDRTLLIEDTRYTDGDDLDHDLFRTGVRDYAAQRGWVIETVLREEEGVLPVALDGDIAAHLKRLGPTALSGLRAGLFHPTTGYSLPSVSKRRRTARPWPRSSVAMRATYGRKEAFIGC